MLKQLPLEERPREKMIYHGATYLSNSELLAIILRTGTKEKSALELGLDLIKACDNDFSILSQMTLEELCMIEGIGESKGCQILSVMELAKRIQNSPLKRKFRISSPKEVVDFFSPELSDLKVEKFIAVLLNTKNEVIGWEVISIGSLNASIVHPREVFNRAIKRSAASILVVHNHPSGHVAPSKEDHLVTSRLGEVGQIMGIPLIDHIIICKNDYYSFKEANQL